LEETLDRREVHGLLRGVGGEVVEVRGDGGFDFRDCYAAIHERAGACSQPAEGAGAANRSILLNELWKVIEAVNMMRKGQVKRLSGNDVRGQAKFISNLFQIAA